MPRPPGKPIRQIHVQLPPELVDQLDALAAHVAQLRGKPCSRTELIISACKHLAEVHGADACHGLAAT